MKYTSLEQLIRALSVDGFVVETEKTFASFFGGTIFSPGNVVEPLKIKLRDMGVEEAYLLYTGTGFCILTTKLPGDIFSPTYAYKHHYTGQPPYRPSPPPYRPR